VLLPNREALVEQEIPEDVTARFAESLVTADHHPRSCRCSPDYGRFRASEGRRWAVRIQPYVVVGFGGEVEHRA
jgi:hypothetical protein